MDILIEITKEVFEGYVPAAKMPERNGSVFNRLQLQFAAAYQMLLRTVVGSGFESALDAEPLKGLAIETVCVDAFVRTCRSLDLVLTATGFGIVSTESTAPASKVRVDALVEEMSVRELERVDALVQELMKLEGWGLTEPARMRVATLFYRPQQLQYGTTLALTTENWQLALGHAAMADAILRDEISGEYMDELLLKQRTLTLTNADLIVVQKCVAFMQDFISGYEQTGGVPNAAMLRHVVQQIEGYADSYPTYKSSRLYASRHAERYKNKKDDPTFFFM